MTADPRPDLAEIDALITKATGVFEAGHIGAGYGLMERATRALRAKLAAETERADEAEAGLQCPPGVSPAAWKWWSDRYAETVSEMAAFRRAFQAEKEALTAAQAEIATLKRERDRLKARSSNLWKENRDLRNQLEGKPPCLKYTPPLP